MLGDCVPDVGQVHLSNVRVVADQLEHACTEHNSHFAEVAVVQFVECVAVSVAPASAACLANRVGGGRRYTPRDERPVVRVWDDFTFELYRNVQRVGRGVHGRLNSLESHRLQFQRPAGSGRINVYNGFHPIEVVSRHPVLRATNPDFLGAEAHESDTDIECVFQRCK